MKQRVILALLTITILLVACGASVQPQPVVNQTAQSECTLVKQDIAIERMTSDMGSGTYAVIYSPGSGCPANIPTQLCIYNWAGYGGGLSCTPIK